MKTVDGRKTVVLGLEDLKLKLGIEKEMLVDLRFQVNQFEQVDGLIYETEEKK